MKKKYYLFILLLLVSGSVFAATENDLYVDLLKGDYQKLIHEAKNLVDRNAATPKDYYLLGLGLLKLKDYANARHYLEIAVEKSDKGLKDSAALALGDTFFLEGRFPEALVKYNNLLKNNPGEGILPILYLRLAQSNIKQGKWQDGRLYLNKLRSDYPNSLEAQISEPLTTAEEYFCIQAGSFSNQDNAQSFVNELKTKGFKAYISSTNSGNSTLYRVRVGEYSTREEAEGIKQQLDSLGYETKIYP